MALHPLDEPARSTARFELRFVHLFQPGRGFAFPCDERGQVALGALPEPARQHYLQVRARVGHDLASPQVIALGRSTSHAATP
jgi:hypothetical protein